MGILPMFAVPRDFDPYSHRISNEINLITTPFISRTLPTHAFILCHRQLDIARNLGYGAIYGVVICIQFEKLFATPF